MKATIVVTGLLAAATGSAALNWYAWRDPGPVEAMAIASADGRQVLDLMSAPGAASASCDGQPLQLPGDPRRFLVAERRDGALVVGWADRADASPDQVLTVAAGCTTFVAYVDRHRPGTAVVEAWRGWTRESGRRQLTIRFEP